MGKNVEKYHAARVGQAQVYTNSGGHTMRLLERIGVLLHLRSPESGSGRPSEAPQGSGAGAQQDGSPEDSLDLHIEGGGGSEPSGADVEAKLLDQELRLEALNTRLKVLRRDH